MNMAGMFSKLSGMFSQFLDDSKRIFFVSKKPTWDEYKRMALIVALGMVIIGVLAYFIFLLFALSGVGY